MNRSFDMTAASVPGYLHVRGHRNNQDGYAVAADDQALVAFVCDGCGSTVHAEVGAKLGARFLAHRGLALLYQDGIVRDLSTEMARSVFLEELRQAAIAFMRGILDELGNDGRDDVLDYFLFTIVGAIVTPQVTIVATIGDGVFEVNGAYTEIGQDNQPTYLAYDLIDPQPGEILPGPRTFSERLAIPTEELKTLLIGSDGAAAIERHGRTPLPDGAVPGGLVQFHEPRYQRMRFATLKRLTVLGLLNRRGSDDTTLVAITRKEPKHDAASQA